MPEFPHSGHHGQDSITSMQRMQKGAITEGFGGNGITAVDDERTVGFPEMLHSAAGAEEPQLKPQVAGGADERLPDPLPSPGRDHPDGSGQAGRGGGFDGGRPDRVIVRGGGSDGSGSGGNSAAANKLAQEQLADEYALAANAAAKPSSGGGSSIIFVMILIVGGVGAWWYFKHHKKGEGSHPLA